MRDLEYLGGERARKPEQDIADDVAIARAAVGRQPRTGALREALYRHALGAHHSDRYRTAQTAELIAAAIGGSGAMLPLAVRRRLESIVQADLSGVRVHTGRVAAAATTAVGARAFAVGEELVFADGAYAPGTTGGDWLLAHEATHAARHRGPPGIAEDRAAEDQASAVADAYVAAGRVPDAAHVTAVRDLLHSVGVSIEAEDVDRLAVQYGAALGLTRWSLGADRQDIAQRVLAMVAHAHAHQCTGACTHRPRVTPLDDATRSTVERTTGVALDNVSVERGADLGAAVRLGEAMGSTIRLAPEASGDDALARKVRLHEAIHVAQGRVTDSAGPAPTNRTAAVEAEAHAATAAAERGAQQPLGVKADPTQRYGFDLGDVASALGIDPLKFLREHFPQVASFFQGGFGPMLQQLGDAAGTAMQGVLGKIGISDLQSGFDSITRSFKPGGLAFGILHGCCECLDHALHDLMQAVQSMLNSGAAQKIRGWIEKLQDAENNRIIDEITDFFGALKKFGGPILAGIEQVGTWINQADAEIGHSMIWKAIAPLFGLDPGLPPIEAIKKKMSQMWDKVKAGIEAIKQGLARLWTKIKQNTVVAAVLTFVSDCGKLITAIQKVREAKSRDPNVWLGILAKELKGTVFEGLVSSLKSGYTTIVALKNAAVDWFVGILDATGLLAVFNSAVPYLNAIGRAIQRLAHTIQATVQAIKTAISKALDEAARAIKDLWNAVEPYISFVVGLGIAIMMTFSGDIFAIPRFVVGQLWLHVLPQCYKEKLVDFLLDLFIKLVDWFPAKHPIMNLLRSAGLSFLRTIKGAPMPQKIGAMDTIAKVMSNDIEVLAGFFVGIVKGLWNSSLGFIVQAAIFPFQMAWDVLSTVAEKLGGLAGQAFGAVFDGAAWIVHAMANAKQRPRGAGSQPGADQAAPASDAQPGAGPEGQAGTEPQPQVSTTVEVGPTVEGQGAGSVPSAASSTASNDSAPSSGGRDSATPAPAPANAPAASTTTDGSRAAPAPGPDHPTPGPGASAPATPTGGHGGGDSIFEDIPPFPHMPPLRDLLDHVFNKGVSREETEEMFKKFNIAMDQWGTKLGTEGANKILPFLNARSAPYDIGEIVGEVVGWLAGEIIMLVCTEGIENAIAKFMEGAMDGARIMAKIGEYFPKLAEWLMDMRKLIEPLIEAVEKIAAKAKEFLQKIMKWLEEMLAWVKRQFERILKWLEETLGEAGKMVRKAWNWLVKHGKEGELYLEAKTTAEEAWAELTALTTQRALPEPEMRQLLTGVRVLHTPDVHIQLSLYHEGRIDGISWWGVRSVASKGGKSETAHGGMGAVLTPDGGTGLFFSTHEFLGVKARHETVIETAYLEIERAASIGTGVEGLTAAYEQKQAAAEAAQLTGQREVINGCKFTITLEPLNSPDVQGRQHFSDTTFLIAPNATKHKKKVHIVPDTDLEKLEKEIRRTDAEHSVAVEALHRESSWTRKQLEECGTSTEVQSYRSGLTVHEEKLAKLRLTNEKLELDITKAREWYVHGDHQAGIKVFHDELFPRCEKLKADAIALEPERPKGDWDTTYVELKAGKLMLKPIYWDIRAGFYPHDYRPDTKKRRDAALNTRMSNGEKYWFFAGPPLSPRGDQWWKFDDDKEKPTIAHNAPTVKDHWEGDGPDAGRATNQPTRANFYNLVGKPMEIEPKTFNSAKGAIEVAMTKEVKKTFRGKT